MIERAVAIKLISPHFFLRLKNKTVRVCCGLTLSPKYFFLNGELLSMLSLTRLQLMYLKKSKVLFYPIRFIFHKQKYTGWLMETKSIFEGFKFTKHFLCESGGRFNIIYDIFVRLIDRNLRKFVRIFSYRFKMPFVSLLSYDSVNTTTQSSVYIT